MTIEEFQNQLLKINSDWIAIQTQIAGFDMAGQIELKEKFLASIHLSIELMHANLDLLLNSLSKEQKAELPAHLRAPAATLKANMFKLCGSHYQQEFIAAKEERKNLDDLRNQPLEM